MEKDKTIHTVQAKKDKLEQLCRALQTERTELTNELKTLRNTDEENVGSVNDDLYDDQQDKLDDQTSEPTDKQKDVLPAEMGSHDTHNSSQDITEQTSSNQDEVDMVE